VLNVYTLNKQAIMFLKGGTLHGWNYILLDFMDSLGHCHVFYSENGSLSF
jgi:hypothetical protein